MDHDTELQLDAREDLHHMRANRGAEAPGIAGFIASGIEEFGLTLIACTRALIAAMEEKR